MKSIFLAATFLVLALSSNLLKANTTCLGKTEDNKVITISVTTRGAMGNVIDATVEIADIHGNTEMRYVLLKNEIPQYFDGCRDKECKTTIVGLKAYKDASWPIRINFLGSNFGALKGDTTTESFKRYYFNRHRIKENGNSLTVWKGDKDLTLEQAFYKSSDVTCNVDKTI